MAQGAAVQSGCRPGHQRDQTGLRNNYPRCSSFQSAPSQRSLSSFFSALPLVWVKARGSRECCCDAPSSLLSCLHMSFPTQSPGLICMCSSARPPQSDAAQISAVSAGRDYLPRAAVAHGGMEGGRAAGGRVQPWFQMKSGRPESRERRAVIRLSTWQGAGG